MPRKINVLRQFHFSRPPTPGMKLPVETVFPPGEHEIDDEMADHPWIARDNADGAIETPQAAQARADAAQAALDKAQRIAEEAKASAQSAMDRVERAAPASAKASELSAEALNTPVHELRQQSGKGITEPVAEVPKAKKRG